MSETLAKYNVILELITETKEASGVKNELSGLQKEYAAAAKNISKIIGKDIVNDAVAGIRNLRKEIGDIGKVPSVDKLFNELEALAGKTELTADEFERLKAVSNQLGEELGTLLPPAIEDMTTLATNAGEVTEKFTSAKQELANLMKLITSNQLEGEALEKAKERAAQLQDTIGDTREEISKLSSDTRGIDTLIEGTRLLTAGFGIAEGAAALFGDENEEIQKALVKLNAIMVISNGLQEAHALLLQNSNIAMKLATAQQTLYNVVVGQSSGALKVFRLALAGTGIGLIVILLGTLIANWDKVKKTVSENSEEIIKYAKYVTLLIPPLNLLIQAAEYVYKNFDKIKNSISGLDDAVLGFLGSVGDVFGELFSGDFAAAYKAATEIGEKTGKAYTKGVEDSIKQANKEKLIKAMEEQVKSIGLVADRLDAQGLESFKAREKIILDEIELLKLKGAATEEIYAKETELIALRKEKEDADAKAAEEARKKALAEAERLRKIAEQNEIAAANKLAYMRKIKAEETIEDEQDLSRALQLIEIEKQIAINRIQAKYAKAGSAELSGLNLQLKELEREKQAIEKTVNEAGKIGLAVSDANVEFENTLTIIKTLEDFAKSGKLSKAFGNDIKKVAEAFGDITGAIDKNRDQVISKVKDMMKVTFEETNKVKPKKSFLEDFFDLTPEQAENFKKLLDDSLQQIVAGLDTVLQKEVENNQLRIDLQQKRVDKALALAEKGNVKQLKIEEERLAKLEEKQEAAVNRQKTLQEAQIIASQAVAAAKSIEAITNAAALPFPANVPAIAATVLALGANIAAITSTIKGSFSDIPNFIEGTEEVGADPRFSKYKYSNSRDGYRARFDGKERIVDPVTNMALGKFPNALLPEAVKLYKLMPYLQHSNNIDMSGMVDEVRELRRSVESLQMNVRLDKHGFMAEQQRMVDKAVIRTKIMG